MFAEDLQFEGGHEITAIPARPLSERATDIHIRIEHIVIISIVTSSSGVAFMGMKNVNQF
jgi:hypothetical protein